MVRRRTMVGVPAVDFKQRGARSVAARRWAPDRWSDVAAHG